MSDNLWRMQEELNNLWRIANLELWESGRDSDPVLLRVTEPLLTREEAANDPEVRRMVAAKAVGTLTVSDDQWRDYWHSNNDLPSGRYAIVPLEVTDDE